MAWHLPPCTGSFQRSCSIPQTLFFPHRRDETLVQEGAVGNLPLWEREPSLFLLGSCSYSLEVEKLLNLDLRWNVTPPEILLVFLSGFLTISVFNHLYELVSFENCLRGTSLMWKEDKVNTSTSAHYSNRGHFGSSLDFPIDLLGKMMESHFSGAGAVHASSWRGDQQEDSQGKHCFQPGPISSF